MKNINYIMKTYIYTLSDPRNNEVRYVGKALNPNKRFINHLSSKNKTHCRSWIKSLLDLNLLPILDIIDETENNWELLEQYWISQFKCWGFNLTNHTIGGEGQFGRKASLETKNKMSLSRQGKKLSKLSKEKISFKNKGNIKTEIQKEKIASSLKEFYSQKEHPIKGFRRGICNNKLQKEQVLDIQALLKQGKTTLQISKLFNVSKATIQQIKEGRTWQSLGEFRIKGKTSRLKQEDLQVLYKLFESKTKVKDIQKILPYCISTIAKQRKIWKQIKKELD